MDSVLFYLPYFLVSLLGMFAHFLKKKVKGESLVEIKSYFESHFKSTMLAFVGTFFGFVGLVAFGEVSYLTAPMVGYLFDSIFNKWDTLEETKQG